MAGIKKIIPNTITSLNLLCGAAGIITAMSGNITGAFILMLCGAFCDFFDGMSARALGVSGPMGKELDSLADVITFGLLPSIMLMCIMTGIFPKSNPLCWTPLLISAFSALRLAKFNLDSRQSSTFIGLPTPACAMICGGLAAAVSLEGGNGVLTGIVSHIWVIPAISAAMCALLVCELPMFSMKLHKGEKFGADRLAFVIILAVTAVTVPLLGLGWPLILLTAFIAYILINIIAAILKRK